MKHLIIPILLSILIISNTTAQSIIGTWKTIDDVTGEAKSHIDIYEDKGKVYGKISKLLLSPQDKTCDTCPGDKKNKNLVGMVVFWDMKNDGYNQWSGGKILDPENGKTYKCKLWFEEGNDNQLNMRGYIGISLLGRNQQWQRVN